MNELTVSPSTYPQTPTEPFLTRWRRRWENLKVWKTGRAYRDLTAAMKKDAGYAQSWHANIAMPILDNSNGALTHEQANQIATKLMRHLFGVTMSVAILALPLLTGCAHFTTTQLQLDTLDATGKILNRKTETHAASTTFFDSKSALANFKATQTDKTQTAIVGALNQEASGSNVVALTESVVRAAVTGAVKAAIPIPTPPIPAQ